MTARDTLAKIDALMPYRGACAFCGGDDARHGEWESWRGSFRAEGSVERVAHWYAGDESLIRLVVSLTPQQYGALLRVSRAVHGAPRKES